MEGLNAILPYLFKRKWVLLKCPDNSGGFVTSDHPVCLTWTDPKKRHPPGHGLPRTELMFPISSRLAMVGSFEIQEDEIVASEELVAAVNATIIQFSERHVYARDYNFHYALEWGEALRKASKLMSDRRLRGSKE